VDQAVGLALEQSREAPLEDRLLELSLLQRDQKIASFGVAGEARAQRLRLDPYALAVGAEGLEQVRRQHATPVDQERRARLPAAVLRSPRLWRPAGATRAGVTRAGVTRAGVTRAGVTRHRRPPRPGARARARRP